MKILMQFFLLLLLVQQSQFTQEITSSKIWKYVTLETFENLELDSSHFQSKIEEKPNFLFSTAFVSPKPGSKRSLLLRFNKESNSETKIIFPKPILIKGFISELQFQIYSSGTPGSLYYFMSGSDLTVRRLFLTDLNFQGWREIKTNIGILFDQNDLLIGQDSSLSFIGFLYIPEKDLAASKEVLLGFDDIQARVRKKYKILSDPGSLLQE